MPIKKSKVKSQKSKVQNKETTPLGKAASSAYTLYPIPSGGYTLIELLIVIAIIAILSMTSFVYFNNFGVSQGVDRNVLIIQNAIEIAQTNASTGLKCRSSSGAPSDSTGWIVEFSGTATNPNINLICKSTDAEVTVKSYTLDRKAGIPSITPPGGVCATVSYPTDSIAIFYGPNASQNKFIFKRGDPINECSGAKSINIKVNYDGDTNYKTFGLNLSGAINEVTP